MRASKFLSLKLSEFLCYLNSLITKNLLEDKIHYGSQSSSHIELCNNSVALDISKRLCVKSYMNVEHHDLSTTT